MIDNDIKARLLQVRRGLAPSRHPVNQIAVDEASFGERLADRIAEGIGSWRFLIVQTVAVCAWVGLNVIGLINRWDPYPFVLLNLLFSVQAAYTGPVLLLAGNRQSQKDRLTLEHAAGEAEKADKQDVEILTRIRENTELTVQILKHLEEQRTELLRRMEASGMLSSAGSPANAGDADRSERSAPEAGGT
jgi:uncharacterized membrane protein